MATGANAEIFKKVDFGDAISFTDYKAAELPLPDEFIYSLCAHAKNLAYLLDIHHIRVITKHDPIRFFLGDLACFFYVHGLLLSSRCVDFVGNIDIPADSQNRRFLDRVRFLPAESAEVFQALPLIYGGNLFAEGDAV